LLNLLESYVPNISFNFLIAAQLRYIKESEEIRLAMLPVELIKRVSLELVLFTIFVITMVVAH